MKKSIFALVMLVGYQASVSAASLAAFASVKSFDDSDNFLAFICNTSTASSLQTQCQGTHNFLNSVQTYDTHATADYGVLKAYAASSLAVASPGVGGPGRLNTGSTGRFQDQWTITGETAGTAGTLELTFDITGSTSAPVANTGVGFGLTLANHTFSTFASDSQKPPYTGLLTTSFNFGEELDFTVALTAASNLFNLTEGGTDGIASFMDMSNTALMSAIVVKDSGGNIVPFGLSTVSGAALFNELAPIPIPAAVWLFGSGLGLLGWLRRRQTA